MAKALIPIIIAVLASVSDAKLANFPLKTSGSRIVDTLGNTVRLACTNWYGGHMERYVVNGLDLVNIDELSQMIADQGFNCVRLPFSLE